MFHLNRTIHQLKDGEARECDGKQRRKEYTSIYDVREFFSVFAALVPLRISVSVCVCSDVVMCPNICYRMPKETLLLHIPRHE